METELIIHETPHLSRPWLIGGYEGWVDAGKVSTGSLTYLRESLKAQKFAEILSDGFHHFKDFRPRVVVEDGLIHQIEYPKNEFYFWKNSESSPDLIFFIGHEPHFRWKAFADLFVKLAVRFGVERLITIGGLYDQVVHTIPRKISTVAGNPELLKELLAHDVETVDYAGPGSYVSLLQEYAETNGIGSFMLWGRIPPYMKIRSSWDCIQILELLSKLVPFEIDLSELREEAKITHEQLQRAVEEQPDLKTYVKQVESMHRSKHPGKSKSGDNVITIEAFLKHVDKGDKKKD
ncbi:MAG: PAC2 family protein [Syntrophobacterales bacterium]|nr:MAG: PAC2 family protein [Syntrophobacterales bacterium]